MAPLSVLIRKPQSTKGQKTTREIVSFLGGESGRKWGRKSEKGPEPTHQVWTRHASAAEVVGNIWMARNRARGERDLEGDLRKESGIREGGGPYGWGRDTWQEGERGTRRCKKEGAYREKERVGRTQFSESEAKKSSDFERFSVSDLFILLEVRYFLPLFLFNFFLSFSLLASFPSLYAASHNSLSPFYTKVHFTSCSNWKRPGQVGYSQPFRAGTGNWTPHNLTWHGSTWKACKRKLFYML